MICNIFFERVEQLKYLGIIQTNRNSLYEEITSRLNSGRALLSFGAEVFVFELAIQKYKDEDTQNYNFACCFVRV
jgi:hypothetical protein